MLAIEAHHSDVLWYSHITVQSIEMKGASFQNLKTSKMLETTY